MEMPGKIEWLRYVPKGRVAEYEVKGWKISCDLNGTSHGAYSVLMVYTGEGEPSK
jgi:uncharacterized Zn finger protein